MPQLPQHPSMLPKNNYVESKGMQGSLLQSIGTAMATCLSVTYATIFMIWLEKPIFNEFRQQIVLQEEYRRHSGGGAAIMVLLQSWCCCCYKR